MRAYFDTSVIAKWYVPEPNSGPALALRRRFRPPATLTHLHRLELATAWQLKVHRREITTSAAAAAADSLREDVDAGVWDAPTYELGAVFGTAERLARAHAAAHGARTLDVLHVAAAMELAEQHFVTADARQAALAKSAGLKVTRL